MDKNDKTVIFQDFARRAKQRIEEKKKKRTKQLYIKDIDMTLTVRGISDEEYAEISEMKDLSERADLLEIERDKYLIYYVCPELQETAQIMVEEGSLLDSKRFKIADIFRPVDRTAICREILVMSGLSGDTSVTDAVKQPERISEVEEVKN